MLLAAIKSGNCWVWIRFDKKKHCTRKKVATNGTGPQNIHWISPFAKPVSPGLAIGFLLLLHFLCCPKNRYLTYHNIAALKRSRRIQKSNKTKIRLCIKIWSWFLMVLPLLIQPMASRWNSSSAIFMAFNGFARINCAGIKSARTVIGERTEELKVRPQWHLACLPKRNSNETKRSIHGYTLQNKTTVFKKKREMTFRDGLGETLSLSCSIIVQQLAPAPPKCLHLSHHLFNRCKHQHLRKNCRCRHLLGISWLKIPSLKLARKPKQLAVV